MPESATGWAALTRALAQPNYRLFVSGQLVSLLGTWTQSVAQTWLIYRLSDSPFSLGVATFCQQAPVLFLATIGGLVADRYRRRSVLLVTQSTAMVLAFLLAALTLTGHVRVGHVYALAVVLGVSAAVDSPTRQSFLIDLVGRDNLPTAVTLSSSLVTIATVVGPAIAGIAIHAVGEGACFLINGVSFLAVIGSLLAMRDLPAPAIARTREPMRSRLLQGFRFVATEPRVRSLLMLLAVAACLSIPSATLMPVVASKVLGGDARTLGWLMGTQGLGALLAGLALASRRSHRHTHRWIAGACALNGVALAAFAFSRSLPLSLALMLPIGAGTLVHVAATNGLVQSLVPDELRGRVMAIWIMILMGFSPVGSILAGWVGGRAGPRIPLLVGGVACALAAAIFARRAPFREANDG